MVHRFEILKARFRFNDLKFKRFRFGSGSPKKSVCFRFAVQIRVRFDSLVKTLNFDKLNAIHEVMMGDKLLLLHMVAGAKLGNVPPPQNHLSGLLQIFFLDGDTKEQAPKGQCQARGSGGMPPQKILRNLTLFWRLAVRFQPLKFLSFNKV